MKKTALMDLVLVISLSLIFSAGPAAAKVYIDIDSPMIHKFPIAVADFHNLGGAPVRGEDYSARFSGELDRVLQITGYFNILDKKAFLEDPRSSGITADKIRFMDWTAIGAESLVKGGYSNSGANMKSQFRLFDCVSGKLLLGKEYNGRSQDWKEMVYKFAGEVVLAMTGEAGIFDTKIAFSGRKGKATEIYMINFDGSGFEKITRANSLTIRPQWGSNGREICYTSYKDANPDLYGMSLTNRKERRISRYIGLNLAGPWSPDGRYMLLTLSKDGNPEIYRMDTRTSTLKRLTFDMGSDVSPCWSPDGSQIAFVSDRGGSPQIYMMNSDGGNVKRLSYEGNYNTSPSWSPKSRKIAYESRRGGSFQIFTMNENGSKVMQVTANGWNESPCWSPDGRYLVFSGKSRGKARLYVVNANGSNLRVLHEGLDGYSYTSWSPHLNLY